MDPKNYIFRNSKRDDLDKIEQLLNMVFTEEEGVGKLASVATDNLPGLSYNSWYLIENKKKLVAALARVEWNISFDDIKLNVWEQAIVGTLKNHRKKGLIRELNRKLDIDANKSDIDLIIIQGIPCFYNKFGYRYAIDFENHINLKLHTIKDKFDKNRFRLADSRDYRLFKDQESVRKDIFSIQSIRSQKNYEYILEDSKKTDYSSDIWVLDNNFYFKVQKQGFGDGLIVSELSEDLTSNKLDEILPFLKSLAKKDNKPYIRFDISAKTPISNILQSYGAKIEGIYGWQVKIVDRYKFLNKIKPILNRRLKSSIFKTFTGSLSLIIEGVNHILNIKDGVITRIFKSSEETQLNLTLPDDLAESLFLGFRSFDDLNYIRPDLISFENETKKLINVLFPPLNNWLYSIW